ncbi:hypothetical protein Poly30_17060 [Planctomycetes bacterium Poly30]|uniref:16S rRNA m(4)C1402 methyltransferase n=1 Tax=Saltatorellus ferox TaxID=2528018 RepID=A0A518EQ39_9BACT|nr:hypothetical protein Poly30_17060 [Planctomycetes bacterium Poly30]
MDSARVLHWTEEALDQRNVVALLHERMAEETLEGALVVDATAGNGHDTEFLARAVGASGEVLAIDLQASAVEATRRRLAGDPDLARRVRVIEGDHATLADLTPTSWAGRVSLVVFNLGYLPGGSRAVTTRAGSSRAAAAAALELLAPDGLLCMALYTGHPGGAEEAATLRAWSAEQASPRVRVHHIRDAGDGAAGRPEVLLIRRRAASNPQEDPPTIQHFEHEVPASDPDQGVAE